MKHLNIKITGKVQGVFFRQAAKDIADDLDIFGFARNEEGGTVYIEAEGREDDLVRFVKWCEAGPENAQVERVEITEGPLVTFKKFDIEY